VNTAARVVTVAACGLLAVAANKPDAKEALVRVQQYLEAWQQQLSAIVAEELYEQSLRSPLPGSGTTEWRLRETRRLRSDVLLLRAPADNLWLCFRDVLSVDDKPVHDRQARFDALFNDPSATLIADAKLIADETARYNLGFHRTVNTPTAAFVFLVNRYARNMKWSLRTNERLGDRRVWMLRFEQHRAPFAVHAWGTRPLRSSGRIWVEPDSARILRTELVVEATGKPTVVTDFAYVASVDAWAAVRMEERFQTASERITGIATYTNHRLFRTSARIIGN